jgi:putative nucleotidyltransferase with HDIG domain
MKDCSKALYKPSIIIGDLSGKAAKYIGANEDLAQAGGYYHEVGKIKGKNYIEEGLKIAEEYGFPDELTNILRQHNIKYDKPTFIESAIVMISDNVVSTIDYINKTEDQSFEAHKIIDNIFRMRMEKGTFDDSGLSVRNFKQLKDFYQKEFKEEESNEEQFKDGELVE